VSILAAYDGDVWIDWSWVGDHGDEIVTHLREHAELTALSIGLGLLIAVPLGLLAAFHPRVRGVTIAATGVLYTIPSLAAFALLLPWTGLSRATAVIPLASYTLLIIIRNIVAGIHGVPREVREAATGMGYTSAARIGWVDIPLALPAMFAGLRIALVTVIGLIPVAALVGQGGLGRLMRDGFDRGFRTPLTVGIVLTVALAVVCDLAVLLAQRVLMPWSRRRRA